MTKAMSRQLKPYNSKLITNVLWWSVGLLLTALALRFGMRAVGVRGDTPLPGLVYALTTPLVEPFSSFAPIPERFDYAAFEAASLLAVGAVLGTALGLYVVGLLLLGRNTGGTTLLP